MTRFTRDLDLLLWFAGGLLLGGVVGRLLHVGLTWALASWGGR
jgi:hypothetical protein